MSNAYVNDFSPTVKTYYGELKSCRPLTREKEKNLLIKAKQGDINAQNEILTANLKFVFLTASKYKGKGVPLPDLISEGNMGLIKAIEKFDVEKGVKFISYAVWWIRNSIQEYIKKQQSILSHEKDDDELNCKINISSFKDYEEDEFVTVGDTIEDDDSYSETIDRSIKSIEVVNKILEKLDNRERYIVKRYYGIGAEKEMNLEEIGNELGITKERVRQIKRKSMDKLRSEILLLDYADMIF